MEETQPASQEARYPLAYDGSGNPIELSADAVSWRVRRGGGRRGRPRHVFDAETGRQLEIPITANLDTLIDSGCAPDRYLLYPIDGQGHVIPGIIAVTEVAESPEGGDGGVTAPVTEHSAMLTVMTHQLATIKEQSLTLCRALEATTSGYGRVRPMEPPQPPMYIEQSPPALPDKEGVGGFMASIKPEHVGQFLNYVQMFVNMLRGGGTPPPAMMGSAAGGP